VKRWFLILFAAFSVWTTSAHAETTKVVVRSFSGPGAAGVRRAVVKQLKTMKGVKVVDEAAAERVAKKNHVSLAGNNGKREVAGILQIAAWVEGSVRKKGGKFAANIEVTDAASGQEAGAWSFAAKKPKLLEATVKRNFKKKLRDAFSDVHPPEASGATEEPEEEASTPDEAEDDEPYPASEEEPVESEPVAEQSSPEPEPVAQATDEEKPTRSFSGDAEQRIDGDEAEEDERQHSAIAAYAGLAILNRSLEYNQAFTQNIGNYSLPAAPIADFGLRVYPGAFFSDGWGAHIGLDLHGQLAFGLNSETSDGTRYPTSYSEYDGSLIGRLPIARHELHLAVGYKAQSFAMQDKGSVEAPVSDVDYKAARAALGARFELVEGYGLGFDVAYLYLFGMGELESAAWFPNATGAGIEGQVFVDARLYKAFGARLFASYQRQFFDFNSQLNDTRVAGGAVDAYISGGLALALNY
jgi:hypothetical protein